MTADRPDRIDELIQGIYSHTWEAYLDELRLPTKGGGQMSDDEGKVIATIPRGDKKQIRVTTSLFKERTYIHIREYILIDDFWQATKKGVALRVEDAPLLFDAIRDLYDELKRTGDV